MLDIISEDIGESHLVDEIEMSTGDVEFLT
jgi:hypothetical protein